MSIRESDVSVLIPSYRRPDMTRSAVLSGCATGAGEIVISDDASNDGTVEAIRTISDSRLRIVVQPSNLGLWRNHLALLRLANRPWVKFLQNDDRIAPGGLGAMVAQATAQTAVVSAVALYEDQATGSVRQAFALSSVRRWSSDEYMRRLLIVGHANELGTPSDVLYRREVLDLSDDTWRNDRSMDLICNVLAASRGEVVLLPPGPTITIDHPGRDTHQSGLQMWYRRLLSSVNYLRQQPDPRIRRFARIYGFTEGIGGLRMAAGALRRGWPLYRGLPADFARILTMSASPALLADLPMAARRLFNKYGRSGHVVT